MRIVVIGAGAVGTGMAVLLGKAGHDVALLGREGHIESAKLDLKGVEHRSEFSLSSGSNVDLAVVTTKAYDISSAVEDHRDLLRRSYFVLYLQNGLGIERSFAAFPQAMQGILWVSAERVAPAHSLWRSNLRVVLDESVINSHKVSEAICSPGIKPEFTHSFQEEVFKKLMVNLACNPVSAVYRLRNSEIGANADARGRAIAAAGEIRTLAAALGYRVQQNPEEIIDSMASRLGEFKSSTLQDLEAGKPLELESILAEPLLLGESLGINMPEIRSLYNELLLLR